MNTPVFEINKRERFTFGSNWTRFLENFDEHKIKRAEESLCRHLGRDFLQGLRFLDAGCESGLFSLAARRLGAEVYSFDFDPESVACTEYLRNKFFPRNAAWIIEVGSVLIVNISLAWGCSTSSIHGAFCTIREPCGTRLPILSSRSKKRDIVYCHL